MILFLFKNHVALSYLEFTVFIQSESVTQNSKCYRCLLYFLCTNYPSSHGCHSDPPERDFQALPVCWGQKRKLFNAWLPKWWGPSQPLVSIVLHGGLQEKAEKSNFVFGLRSKSRPERYASTEEHFVLWYLMVTVADRKWDGVFHFPVAIFTHKLNKDLFATGLWLHLPTFHIPKGRQQFCNQECNLHHGFHICCKCWNMDGVRNLEKKKKSTVKIIIFTFWACWFRWAGEDHWLTHRYAKKMQA